MREPLISFIVVTHDRPLDLIFKRIIKSIINQTYPRKELIIVGENAPHIEKLADNILRSSSLERVEFLNVERRPEDNDLCTWALVARARNRGIDMAHGEFISCQDDDNELVPEFSAQMLRNIDTSNVKVAWCWRRVVESNGTPFRGDYFPWIEGDERRRAILFRIWKKAGVIEEGSDIIRDTLWACHGSERFSTVDPNEWLVHRDVFKAIPYRENYSHEEIAYHITFDDLWDKDLTMAAIPVTCWEYPGLIYYLGGASNSRLPAFSANEK